MSFDLAQKKFFSIFQLNNLILLFVIILFFSESRLVQWLKLIVKSRSIIECCYFDWSYVVSTGFDDALRSLDRLTNIKFRLPTDLAVRQLQNISDAF